MRTIFHRSSKFPSLPCLAALCTGLCLVFAAPTLAQPLEVEITADNAYELWTGDADGVLSRIGGDENCLVPQIFDEPESYTVNNLAGASHLYVVAYSDDSGLQGLLGEFTRAGETVYSGDAAWEVLAMGSDLDLNCGGPSAAPPRAQVTQQIRLANAGNGAAGGSRGWVDAQGAGGDGRLAVGQANQPNGPLHFEVVDEISGSARWMWYDRAPGGASPLFDGNQGEFLVFRLPLSVFSSCADVPPGRISWWPFDEEAGPTAQDVILGTDGTWMGSPQPVAGRVDTALSFPADDDYLDIPDRSTVAGLGSGDFSLDLWVRSDDPADASGVRTLLDKRNFPNSPLGWSLFLFNGELGFQLAEGGGNAGCGSGPAFSCTNFLSGAVVTDGNWHFVAVSVDRNGQGFFYVDGAVVATFDPSVRPGSLRNSGPLLVAREAAGFLDAPFSGAVDELELYPYAIGEATLDAIYGAGEAGKCKGGLDVPWDTPVCPGDEHATASVVVCNDAPVAKDFRLSFAPLAPKDGCDVAGPTEFEVLGGNPVSVPGGSCTEVRVRIEAPVFPADRKTACYQVVARSAPLTLVSEGSLQDHRTSRACLTIARPVDGIPFGSLVTLDFRIDAEDDFDGGTVDYTVQAYGPDMEPAEALSLDGLAPGQSAAGAVTVEPGERTPVSVGARLVSEQANAFYDVVFNADIDGDGEPDMVSSAALRSVARDCVDGLGGLCLNADRFKVAVEWTDFAGNTGSGAAVPLTSDTGYFWFFRDSNVELVVKVLDGRPINGNFWVFYGALSNVEYTITVEDTESGDRMTYRNPAGQFASVGDTGAFPQNGAAVAPHRVVEAAQVGTTTPLARDPFAFAAAPGAVDGAQTGACAEDAGDLCLNGDRFRVEVEWTDFEGNTGSGAAVPLTGDTGYFWFFRDSNVELIVKVLDGRPLNGNWWVFYGALSNVAYEMTVTDTATGASKTYTNPSGTFASQGDTGAFED